MLVLPNHMALPTTATFAECADFGKSFSQFLPQLYELPNAILSNLGDTEALKSLYASTNPAISSFAFTLLLCPIFYIGGEVNKNYSQVDRVWSILPSIYNAHYTVWARMNGLPTDILDQVLGFSVVWSFRLTYNYWRKGGYQIGSEDYRWLIIKERIGNFAFTLLNIFFISSWQILILWAITTPTYLILLTSRLDATPQLADTVFSRILNALVVFEWFADQQMWDYQQAKKIYNDTATLPPGWSRGQMERGFVTTGLWRWSRHPNFAAEQTIWVLLYAWGCWRTGTWFNWTALGALQYVGVFQGSTPLTEEISAGKYGSYRVYQERVGKFFPKLFGKRWDEQEMHRIGPKLDEDLKKKQRKSK